MDFDLYGSFNSYLSSGYGYDNDHIQFYVKQFRDEIESDGFIRYSNFSEIETGYNVAIIHKPAKVLPEVIRGKFIGIKDNVAQVVTNRRGIARIISNTKILDFSVDTNSEYEIYASSGSFDTWENILPFLSEG